MALEKSSLDALRIDRASRDTDRNWWPWLGLGLLLLLVFLLIAWRVFRPGSPEVEVYVVHEGKGSGQTALLNSSGYVVARREATVSSKVTGKVTEVLVEEGMRVEAGQILARLDSSNVQTSLDLAAAQLGSARSALKETEVRLHAAELELRRVSGLATNRVTSEAQLDQATADANSLRARLGQQTADIAVAERQLALWQQQMDDTLIRAPFGGIVVSKNAQPGEMISPVSAGGGFTRTGICTIVDMESLEIEIDVSESYINRVRSGQPVEATLDAYPEWKIPCKVKAIIPTADRQKATVKVRVTFDQLDPRILPQMGVKVAFYGGAGRSEAVELLVPRSAVRELDGRQIVFLVRDGQVERRAVKVEGNRGDQVALSAGVGPGDRIVVNPPPQMKEGDRVKEKAR
ncbi:MAG: efflux RND transporter periplasmic adaptor subunit [Verrucomicrobiota bacterium]